MKNKHFLDSLTDIYPCTGYIRSYRMRGGTYVYSWMVYGKTISDVYGDIWRAAYEDRAKTDSVKQLVTGSPPLVNILNLGSSNHNKRLMYDYGSAPMNDEFDSIQAVRVTVRKNVIDIYVYMPEKPRESLIKFINEYCDKRE